MSDIELAAERLARMERNRCPKCGGTECHVENYDMTWHDGDVVCNACDTYVRGFDAG